MEFNKLNVKLFARTPDEVSLADFIEIFHGWIQATDGLYHDVADYSHMHAGPGVVLIARDANLSIDEADSRRGLLYRQKTPLDGSNQEKFRAVLRAALEQFDKLEREPRLAGKFKFAGNEACIAINDRLAAPHTEESFAAASAAMAPVVEVLFAGADVRFEREADRRKPVGFRIRTSRSFTVAELLRRLPKAGREGRGH